MAFATRLTSCSFLTGASRRRVGAVRAEDENKFFDANRLARRGYLEEDSAGQENIFAVQPRRYVQGSAVDDTTGAAGNTFFGVAGAAVGLVVIAAGTGALFVQDKNQPGRTFDGDFTGLNTLSEYKAEFMAQMQAPVEAPTP